jgi:hypothetical protein
MTETVRGLLASVGKEAAFAALFRQCPEEQKNLAGYERAWRTIVSTTPVPSMVACSIYREHDDYDDSWRYGIHGRAPDGEGWAIEYRPWAEWLSMPLHNETGADVPAADFAGAILFEMTWAGYDPDEVQEQFDEIVDAVKEAKEAFEASEESS